MTTGGKLAEQARADGVPVIPIPGGFQPRSAVAYMTVAALEVAAQCGCGPRMASEIDVAASHAEALAPSGGPDGPEDSLPKEIARGLLGSVPVIAGAGLTAPIAYRWKTQVNENAKSPAFSARAAGARPQRDRRLGGRRATSARSRSSCSTTPTCTRACATGSS